MQRTLALLRFAELRALAAFPIMRDGAIFTRRPPSRIGESSARRRYRLRGGKALRQRSGAAGVLKRSPRFRKSESTAKQRETHVRIAASARFSPPRRA